MREGGNDARGPLHRVRGKDVRRSLRHTGKDVRRSLRGATAPSGLLFRGAPFLLALLLPTLIEVSIARGADAIRTTGDALQLILPASAAALTVTHRDGTGTIELAESAAASLGLTYSLKYTIAERRPNGGSYSFPSGHTTIAFCSAEFIRRRYGWRSAIPAFVAASFVGYSRVESKEHYVHDVLAGAAIGWTASAIFTRPCKGCRLQVTAGPSDRGAAWIGLEITAGSCSRP